MKARRVFVFWIHPLFYTSVRLLLNDPNIELVGAASDPAAAHEQIMGLQPDTIILEEGGETIFAEVFTYLLVRSSFRRIIGLNLDDNQLSVYHREQKTVGQVDDLLQLVLQ